MISTQVLSTQTLVIGWLIYVPVVLWAIWRTPWVELFSDTRRQHLLFGTVFGLFCCGWYGATLRAGCLITLLA
jgi:Predicted membrane protein